MASVPQSPFQTMVQNQVGTQSVAQSGVPSAVNNGNPNTVYNVAAQPAPWQTGTQPVPMPMTTAYGQWYIPSATKTDLPWKPSQAQTVQQTQLVMPKPSFADVPQQWITPPPSKPPIPPPVNPGSGGGGGGGSVIRDLPPPYDPLNPRNNGNYTPGNLDWKNLMENSGINYGKPGSAEWNRAAEWSKAVLSRLAGAKEANGKWDWKQIVDMISEPLLGGNLWLSGSNKWDVSNGIASLVQAFTGIPLNNIMNTLGKWQATQNDPADTWLEKALADHWEDNANNEIKVFGETLNRYLTNYADFRVNNINQQNSFANQNWLNSYTNFLADAMLNGMSGQQASDWARAQANAQGRNTTDPNAGSGGGGSAGGGGGGGGWGQEFAERAAGAIGGCVVVDNIIDGYNRADEVSVNDLMLVIDAETFNRKRALVSYSETITRPCVHVTTDNGVFLECSVDAEIADENGNRVLAKDLLGVKVPTIIDGKPEISIVTQVRSIGPKRVQHITAENNWYLAGKEQGRYLLHHNVKYINEYGNRTSGSGWQGSGSITPNGLLWGW